MEKEKKDKKKKSWVWVTVLIVILLIAAIGGGFLAGATYVSSKTMENKSKSKEENTESAKSLEISTAVKEKLERFVSTGLYYDHAGNETYSNFIKGTKDLSKKVKLQMTYNATKKANDDIKLSEEEINKLTGVKPDENEEVTPMLKADFDKTYKELFNEDANYEFEEMTGCPAPMAINNETKTIYLFHRCGGTGADSVTSIITSYNSDTENYYVHSESVWKDLSVAQESSKTTKLLWTFDKDFNFVSVEVE